MTLREIRERADKPVVSPIPHSVEDRRWLLAKLDEAMRLLRALDDHWPDDDIFAATRAFLARRNKEGQ